MKMFTYVIISVFLAIIFEISGISVSSGVLSTLGISVESGVAGFKLSTFWIVMVATLTAGVATGIAIGFITKSPTENFVVLPFIITYMVIFISIMIGIGEAARNIGGWVFYITLLIIAPLIVGFAVVVLDYFRGLA